jgi:hypothetical protein
MTPRGRELEPALIELSRWGSREPLTTDAELSVDALVLAMRTTFDGAAAGDLRDRYEIWVDGDSLRLEIADGELEVTRVAGTDPILDTSAATLRSLIFGRRTLADAERSGEATVYRDRRALGRLLRLFRRPTIARP